MKPTTITINLTDEEVDLAIKALSRLPFGDVYAIIEKLVVQREEQLRQAGEHERKMLANKNMQ